EWVEDRGGPLGSGGRLHGRPRRPLSLHPGRNIVVRYDRRPLRGPGRTLVRPQRSGGRGVGRPGGGAGPGAGWPTAVDAFGSVRLRRGGRGGGGSWRGWGGGGGGGGGVRGWGWCG